MLMGVLCACSHLCYALITMYIHDVQPVCCRGAAFEDTTVDSALRKLNFKRATKKILPEKKPEEAIHERLCRQDVSVKLATESWQLKT